MLGRANPLGVGLELAETVLHNHSIGPRGVFWSWRSACLWTETCSSGRAEAAPVVGSRGLVEGTYWAGPAVRVGGIRVTRGPDLKISD